MKNKANVIRVDDDPRQAEAAKTSRLRALRLAKEAADKEAAALEAASQPPKASKARSARQTG
jgi:hypothetical protein